MALATPIPTPLAGILPLVEAQILLLTQGLPHPLSTNRIFLVTDDQIPKFQGDQDCLIRPGPIQAVETFSTATGRFCPLVTRTLVITLRTRYAVDMSDRSESWVLDAALGHYVLEEAVVAALHDWQPTDPSGNALTEEDLHFLGGTSPQKDKRDSQWGQSTLSFSCVYQLPMSPTI